MKLQHLGVIFVIIIMPIVMCISEYTKTLVKVSNTQSNYDSILMNSTYDAVRAYQLNTLNNSYASVSQSRVRDVKASVNSFFNSLASGLEQTGYTKEELKEYIPALLFTLYDGYYIYTPYSNIVTVDKNANKRGNVKFSTDSSVNSNVEFDLKPYSYYSCKYHGQNYDIVINYTLDNYISVMGTYNDNYITGSGYYIDASENDIEVNGENANDKDVSLNDKWVKIKKNGNETIIRPEQLGEYISTTESYRVWANKGKHEGFQTIRVKSKEPKYYNYINYNEVKYYYDDYYNEYDDVINANSKNTRVSDQGIPIFYLDNNLKTYISPDMLNTLANYVGCNSSELVNDKNSYFKDVNNYYYYKHAIEFSKRVYPALSMIDLSSIFNSDGSIVSDSDSISDYFTQVYNITPSPEDNPEGNTSYIINNYETKKIFDYNQENNDPELEISSFNQHRIDVITKSIESNLVSTIGGFNAYYSSSYQYDMPTLSAIDWNKIANNVTVVAFMQGLTIGNYKFYNNYSAVANTKNKEYVSKNSIYVEDNMQLNNPSFGNNEYQNFYKSLSKTEAYHNPGCKEYNNAVNSSYRNVIGYRNIDYEIQTFSNKYYTLQNNTVVNGSDDDVRNYTLQPQTIGYECIVSLNGNEFTADDLISLRKDVNGKTVNEEIRRAYISALAREKGASYKSLSNLNYLN